MTGRKISGVFRGDKKKEKDSKKVKQRGKYVGKGYERYEEETCLLKERKAAVREWERRQD